MKKDTKKIAEAIRKQDKKLFLDLRYELFQEGDEIIFGKESFNGVSFTDYGVGFFHFINCVCLTPLVLKMARQSCLQIVIVKIWIYVVKPFILKLKIVILEV